MKVCSCNPEANENCRHCVCRCVDGYKCITCQAETSATAQVISLWWHPRKAGAAAAEPRRDVSRVLGVGMAGMQAENAARREREAAERKRQNTNVLRSYRLKS